MCLLFHTIASIYGFSSSWSHAFNISLCFFRFFLFLFCKVCRNSEPFLLEGELLPIGNVTELAAQGVPQPRGDPAYLGLPGAVSNPLVEPVEEGILGRDTCAVRLLRELTLGISESCVPVT